jgi:LysR family nod box-dependent transcriptional activator
MRLDRLDLNLLVALDALLAAQQVTRAAERLGLTQPAMSGALARLRAHFDDHLVVRVGPRLILTPLGERLRAPVRDLLIRTQALMNERPVFDPRTARRHFCIVSSDFINALLIRELNQRLSQDAPNVSLEMLDPIAGHFYEDLENGEADILIIPRSLTTVDHPSEVLLRDSLVCVVSSDNDQVGDRISLRDYAAMRHVSANFGRARAEGIEANHLRELNVARRIMMSVPQFLTLPQLVVGTDRIATVPRRLALLAARTVPIRIVEPEIDFPVIEELVQWHTHRDPDPGLCWLRGLLGEVASSVTGEMRDPKRDEPDSSGTAGRPVDEKRRQYECS